MNAEPLTVLHAHAGSLYGGIERVLVTLRRLEEAAPLRHYYALGYGGRLANELGDRVTVIGGVRRRYPWTVRSGRRRLRQAIGKIRPRVVLVHGAWAQSLLGPAIRDTGVPMIRWFHAAPEPDDAWERRASECPPRLAICNSRFTASAAAPYTVGVRMEVLHPPVPPPPAAPEPARARLRAHGGASGATSVVLEVARMEEGKGHAVLLDALARLPASLDWQAWFAGGPQRPAESRYFRRLRRRAARAGLGARAVPGRAERYRLPVCRGGCLLPAQYRAGRLRAHVHRGALRRPADRDDRHGGRARDRHRPVRPAGAPQRPDGPGRGAADRSG